MSEATKPFLKKEPKIQDQEFKTKFKIGKPEQPPQRPLGDAPLKKPLPAKMPSTKHPAEYQKAEAAVDRLEQKLANLGGSNHPKLAENEQKLIKLREGLSKLQDKKTYGDIEGAAIRVAASTEKALAEDQWKKVVKENDDGYFTKETYARLERMYQTGESDGYTAFRESATYELEYLALHKARWKKVENGLKSMASETRRQAMMVSLLPGNERMVEVGKKADTLWNDAELAAEMKKDFKLAADLGQQIVMLQREVEAAAKRAELDIAEAGKDWLQLQKLIDKSRQVLNKLIVDLPTIANTAMFKESKDGVNAAAAEKIKFTFDEAVMRQDATHVPTAIKRLSELQIGWAAYQDVADKWDKEKGERARKRKMAIALMDLSGRKAYPQNDDVRKLVVNYLDKLRMAEDIAKNSVESKVRAAEHEAKFAQSEFADTGRVRWEFESWLAKQLEADVDRIISQKKGSGPEAKMMEALKTYDYESERAGILVKAEQLKFAASQKDSDLKIPETLSVAHIAALHLYTKESDCRRMQTFLRGPGQGEPEQTPERKKTMATLVDLAKEGLALLPAFKQDSTRGESAWPGAEKQYVVGKRFVINSFWSTAFGVAFPGTYQITIRPNPKKASGRQIDAFSQFFKENEVLYPPGCEFEVKTVDGNLQDGFKVLVQEI